MMANQGQMDGNLSVEGDSSEVSTREQDDGACVRGGEVAVFEAAHVGALPAAAPALPPATLDNTLPMPSPHPHEQAAVALRLVGEEGHHDGAGEDSPPVKRRKGNKNAGSKKGSKRTERPQSFWYRLCELFERGDYKSQIEFLRCPDSGEDVGAAQRMHFSRAYKKFKDGTLGNVEESRCRKRKYEPLEQRVIQYWTEQQMILEQQEKQQFDAMGAAGADQPVFYDGAAFQQHQDQYPFGAPGTAPGRQLRTTSPVKKSRRGKKGKSPLAWSILQQKAREWAKEMGLDDGFQASAGWIDNVLKRHQRELEAKRNRVCLESTLMARRNWANFASRKVVLEQDIHKADQLALLQSKGLKVGDRVTVIDVSQQPGDLVVSQIDLPQEAEAAASLDGDRDKRKDPQSRIGTRLSDHLQQPGQPQQPQEQEEQPAYLTVERRRHGTVQSFEVTDVRKVVQHMVQEEDCATMRQLLQPGLDEFQTAMAHFPQAAAKGSRVLRPIWEDKPANIDDDGLEHTSTTRLDVCGTSCAEKINMSVLRSYILPAFRRDHKARVRILEELKSLSERTKAQQEALEKLQYAQMTYDMAKDLFEVLDIPARDKYVVYQVDYQALDASMRGRLFALNPAPLSQGWASKSYAARPLTLQSMPEDLRNALVGQFAHLITPAVPDLAVCIFCCLADMAHATSLIPAWLDYRQHATAWCDFIQQVHDGISLEQTQLLPKVLLQGGSYDTWKQAMEEQTEMNVPSPSDEAWTSLQSFVLRLMTEWRALRDVLLTLPQFSWTQIDKTALLSSHDYAPATIPNVCMVRILQAGEREIWDMVSQSLQAQGWTIRAKLVHGLLVEAEVPQSLAAACSIAENSIKRRGWDVGLMEAPCYGKYGGTNQRGPLPLLQEARQVMEAMASAEAEALGTDNNPIPQDREQTRNATWDDDNPSQGDAVGASANEEMGEAEAGKADLQLFAPLV